MATGQYGKCIERHSAVVYDRGGVTPLFQLQDIASVEYTRNLDAKSRAALVITGEACRAQTTFLNQIRERRHELVLFRGAERVWEGPIVKTASTASAFTLNALDVIEYLDATVLSKDWPNVDNGGELYMVDRLREIIEYELQTSYTVHTSRGNKTVPRWEGVNPPANILPYLDVRGGTTKTRAVTRAFEMSVGEHLTALVRSKAVNYTVVGRRIVIWDGTIGATRVVTEKDFSGDIEVIGDGSGFFTVAHVVANGTNGEELAAGHAVNPWSYYGPWDRIISTASEDDDFTAAGKAELNTQARRALTTGARYPVPLVVKAADGSSLIPSAGLTFDKLVPGVEIPLVASRNLRKVKQRQRLDNLTVTETADQESITVTLSAVGDVEAAA